jgi:chromosome segregation ATPase
MSTRVLEDRPLLLTVEREVERAHERIDDLLEDGPSASQADFEELDAKVDALRDQVSDQQQVLEALAERVEKLIGIVKSLLD